MGAYNSMDEETAKRVVDIVDVAKGTAEVVKKLAPEVNDPATR